jgi:anti-sigma B factor antagonist
MPIEIQNKRKAILVSGEMNIYSAREAHDRLLPMLRDAKAPALDLGKVTDFDSSGLQVLIVAGREADAAGKKLTLVAISSAVRDVLELVQCEELLSRSRSAA